MCSSSSGPLVNRSPHNTQVRGSVVVIMVSSSLVSPGKRPRLEAACARCGGQMETPMTALHTAFTKAARQLQTAAVGWHRDCSDLGLGRVRRVRRHDAGGG